MSDYQKEKFSHSLGTIILDKSELDDPLTVKLINTLIKNGSLKRVTDVSGKINYQYSDKFNPLELSRVANLRIS